MVRNQKKEGLDGDVRTLFEWNTVKQKTNFNKLDGSGSGITLVF